MVESGELSDPVVRKFVEAVNADDSDAFFALLSEDATMSDDGSDRNLSEWVDREIFSAHGGLEVESQSDDGRSLIINVTNSTYGTMRTHREFKDEGERVTQFQTSQDG